MAKELDLVRFLLEQAQDVPDAELDADLRAAATCSRHCSRRRSRPCTWSTASSRSSAAVVEAFDARIEFARTGHVDNKTELQEALARSGNQVRYDVVDVEGPPHDRRFVCVAVIAGEQVGIGSGSTKKAAEQEAARQALESMGLVAPEH